MKPGDNKMVLNENKVDIGITKLSDEVLMVLVEAQTVLLTVMTVVVIRERTFLCMEPPHRSLPYLPAGPLH
jgi:hypothetical protein